jgi:hypothetical protein
LLVRFTFAQFSSRDARYPDGHNYGRDQAGAEENILPMGVAERLSVSAIGTGSMRAAINKPTTITPKPIDFHGAAFPRFFAVPARLAISPFCSFTVLGSVAALASRSCSGFGASRSGEGVRIDSFQVRANSASRASSSPSNAASFGWNLPKLEKQQLFFFDAKMGPDVIKAGEFDLSGTTNARKDSR